MGLRLYGQRWLKKKQVKGNIYILPSAFGWIFGLVLLTLFTGAVNYQISAIFLMTFLLAVMGLVSAFEAHNNLKSLSLNLVSVEDAEQGKPGQIILLIKANQKTNFGLEWQIAKQPKTRLELVPLEGLRFIIPIETTSRGYFALPPIVLSSLFPFGIFRVWRYYYFDAHYYVYPKPLSPHFWPLPNQQSNTNTRPGEDEFFDLVQVKNPWQQPNLIAWKIAAKGQGWYLKTMEDHEHEYWLFNLQDLPIASIEIRLQQLSYWLHTAESLGYLYGLDIATSPTTFAQGKKHLQHCLRQLAVYQ